MGRTFMLTVGRSDGRWFNERLIHGGLNETKRDWKEKNSFELAYSVGLRIIFIHMRMGVCKHV